MTTRSKKKHLKEGKTSCEDFTLRPACGKDHELIFLRYFSKIPKKTIRMQRRTLSEKKLPEKALSVPRRIPANSQI